MTVKRGALLFLLAALIVGGLLAWGGERMETALAKYVEWIGWVVVAIAVAAYLILRG